jgi:hypothetical protein
MDTTELRPGSRVQITGLMPHDPDPLPVGSTGTVQRADHSARQADVHWDNGRTLFLLIDVDPYEVIGWVTCTGMEGQESWPLPSASAKPAS